MKLNVILGQDLSAYAEVEIEVPDGVSKEDIVQTVEEAIQKMMNGDDPPVFDENWDSVSSLRIVSAIDEKGGYLIEDHPIEPTNYDAGLVLQSWLNGRGPDLAVVIKEAERSRLIDPPVMEVHRGTFELPGAEAVEVEFTCRKGATREEKDLAFFEALAQIGTLTSSPA